MSSDPRKLIVTESLCTVCGTDRIEVHHQRFPEMCVRGSSAEQAANDLAKRLEENLDAVSDPSYREPVRQALTDVRAFLGREGPFHPARDM